MTRHKLFVTIISIFIFAGVGFVVYAQSNDLLNSENIFDAISVDLKVNGSDGPVEITKGGSVTISWISEGATRCRGVWSKSDLKLSGTAIGKINKSATIKIACINEEGERIDDSVVVKVSEIALPSVPDVPLVQQVVPVPQPASQPVRKSIIPKPERELTQGYPIRTLVLDTLGKPAALRELAKDVFSDMNGRKWPDVKGILTDTETGQQWDIEYEHKGNSRMWCNPPVLNLKFDKTTKKGKPKPLFVGRSTYAGRESLGYKKVRLIPADCDVFDDGWSNRNAGFNNQLNVALREYFIYDIARNVFKIPAVDVVAFVQLKIESPNTDGSKSHRYIFLQRDNEQDDEIPFTTQFGLSPDLLESSDADPLSKNYTIKPGSVKGDNFSHIIYTDLASNQEKTIKLDPENRIRLRLLYDFVTMWDHEPFWNEDYGVDAANGLYKTIPYDFDLSLSCNFFSSNRWGITTGLISSLPKEEQPLYNELLETISRQIFGSQDSLNRMLDSIDRYPFSVDKVRLRDFVKLQFYTFASYYSSEEFAKTIKLPYKPISIISSLPSASELQIKKDQFLASCKRPAIGDFSKGHIFKVLPNPTLKIEVDTQNAGNDVLFSESSLFKVDVTAGSEPLKIHPDKTFSVSIQNVINKKDFMFWGGVIATPLSEVSFEKDVYIISPGKTANFIVSSSNKFRSNDSVFSIGGEYKTFISKISFGEDTFIFPEPVFTNIAEAKVQAPLSVTCSAFSPSLIPIGKEVKWVASVEGGDGKYTYLWNGTDGLDGNAITTTKKYTTVGKKNATVFVTSNNKTVSASCGGVNVESKSPIIVSFDQNFLRDKDSFFHRNKDIFTGKPDQILGAFYASVKKEGQIFPKPSMLVRDLYFKIYNVPIKDVTIIEENPANQNSISGKVIYTLANEASIIFDGPIEIKDGTLYIVRGTVAKSIPVGTQITTHLVNFDASPGINNKDMKFPIVSPPVTVVEMSHSGPSITVTGPVNSYLTPNVINVTFTSSNISRVKIEACVNKTDCTTLANEVSITNPGSGTVSTSWRWEIAGSEPFVGPFGTKQIYIKVTDLASGVFDLADSYIYISSPTSAAASNGIASESASNVSKNQFASPFISGFQDLFLRLFGNR